MTGIVSRGRRGSTIVPNWRWEDPDLSPFDLRVAGWLASHADSYRSHVTRNAVAKALGMAPGTASAALERLQELSIIDIEVVSGEKGKVVRWTIHFDFDVWEGGQQMTSYRSVDDQVGGQQMTTPTTYREEQLEEQGEPPLTPPGGDDGGATSFEAFWKRWLALCNRRRVPAGSKLKASESWNKLTAPSALVIEVLALWEAYYEHPKAQIPPHAATWLNQRRWETPPPDLGAPTSRPKTPEQQAAEDRIQSYINEYAARKVRAS